MNENVSKLKTVVINTEKTIFWRFQRGVTDKNLSTIEAMYFFFREYDKVSGSVRIYIGDEWEEL